MNLAQSIGLEAKLVLASASPRRSHLLSLLDWDFVVIPLAVNETPRLDEKPLAYVHRLAVDKARAAAVQVRSTSLAGNYLIIAADTAVVDGEDILGKPVDEVQAAEMLLRLRGRVHQVYTAVAVLALGDGMVTEQSEVEDGTLRVSVCVSDVPMREYTLEEMKAYIASRDPLDKAGAYAIQHGGFHPVEGFRGCYANVMGLPLCHLMGILKEFKFLPKADIPGLCQVTLDYPCPLTDLHRLARS